MWEWLDALGDKMPPAFIAIWPRGGGKSTGAEVMAIEVGASKRRQYCWYVRETQDQADKSVENVAALLQSPEVEFHYPEMAERGISKYGKPSAWRRNRLTTASGYTIDGMGLDKALRGTKSEEHRPDLIILDDVDGKHDTIAKTTRKLEIITDSILPAGSSNVAVVAIQNLVIPDGVFSRLADGRADMLLNRVVSGPWPAAFNLVYEQNPKWDFKNKTGEPKYIVKSGEPTWPGGQGLDVIQNQINLWGPSAFLREAQHQVERTGGIWDQIEFMRIDWLDRPDFVRTAVWVDPAVTSTDKSDSMGIAAGGIDAQGKIYGIYFWEAVTSPEDALKRAIKKALEIGSLTVGVETDQGGDTWLSVYKRACDQVRAEIEPGMVARWKESQKDSDNPEPMPDLILPEFDSAKAGAGHGSKVERNQKMLLDYEQGQVIHVIGTHGMVEKSLRRFPNKPLDLADAWYWAWHDLRGPSWLAM